MEAAGVRKRRLLQDDLAQQVGGGVLIVVHDHELQVARCLVGGDLELLVPLRVEVLGDEARLELRLGPVHNLADDERVRAPAHDGHVRCPQPLRRDDLHEDLGHLRHAVVDKRGGLIHEMKQLILQVGLDNGRSERRLWRSPEPRAAEVAELGRARVHTAAHATPEPRHVILAVARLLGDHGHPHCPLPLSASAFMDSTPSESNGCSAPQVATGRGRGS
mmetsp:Transcript_46665/g.134406  ORF Transcript_46665/g.134406 Transcript_46665/m.134406 type:complete len:219 (-) Transcript_46665:22-678(-)